MQKITSNKTFIQKKFLGFYAFLLVMAVFGAHAEIQNHQVHACEVETSSIKNKDTKALINISDMLFLLNGFITYDTDNSNKP